MHPDEYAYSHSWLATCQMQLGNYSEAEKEIKKAEDFFKEYLSTNPERFDVNAHISMLKGTFKFQRGQFIDARKEFRSAFEIYREKDDKKGKSRALRGMAGTYAAQRNYAATAIYWLNATKNFSLSFIKTPE